MILPIDYNKASRNLQRLAREEYVRRQNGLCCFCNYPLSQETPDSVKKEYPLAFREHENYLYAMGSNRKTGTFPKGMLDHPVHLHHNHETGLTIGAIHVYCNIISFVYLEIE